MTDLEAMAREIMQTHPHRIDWPIDLSNAIHAALTRVAEEARADERARCARIAKSAWLTACGEITDADHDAALCEAIENAILGADNADR